MLITLSEFEVSTVVDKNHIFLEILSKIIETLFILNGGSVILCLVIVI